VSIKAAVVVVVVVLVLFVTVLVVGGRQDEGSANDRPSLVEWLGDLAGDAGNVALEDVSAACIDDDQAALLVISGTCVLTVTSDAEIARLKLQAVTGTVAVAAPVPNGDARASTKIDGDDPDVTVAVDDGETEITLACLGFGTTCAVRVLDE
jgi:hypothetical protein